MALVHSHVASGFCVYNQPSILVYTVHFISKTEKKKIAGSLSLEKPSESIASNHVPSTAKATTDHVPECPISAPRVGLSPQ